MECKIGDIVHVRATVIDVTADGGRPLHIKVNSDRFWVNLPEIVHVEPPPPVKPLKVGDKVTWGTKAINYKLLAIDDDGWAWLKGPFGRCYTTEPLVNLEHA